MANEQWTELSWMSDPRIQEIKQAAELSIKMHGSVQPDIQAAYNAEVPRAQKRAMLFTGEPASDAYFAAAGSEIERLKEGARMVAGKMARKPELVEAAEADRAARERTMAPLEERYPALSTLGEMTVGTAVPGGAAARFLPRALGAAAAAGGYEFIGSGGDIGRTATAAAVAPVMSEVGRQFGRWMLGRGEDYAPGGGLVDDTGRLLDPETGTAHGEMMERAARLDREMTPRERYASRLLDMFEAPLRRKFYTAGPFIEIEDRNQDIANRIARTAIGMTGSDKITDDMLALQHQNLGRQFEDIIGHENAMFLMSPQSRNRIRELRGNYERGVARRKRARATFDNIEDILNRSTLPNGSTLLNVRDYHELASDIAGEARTIGIKDRTGRRALYEARRVLDESFDNAYGQLDDLRDVRASWRWLRELENARAIKPDGNFDPVRFRRYLSQPNKGGVIQGKEPIEEMSKLEAYLQTQIPNSGTPTGEALTDLMADIREGGLLRTGQRMIGNELTRAYLNNPGIIAGPASMPGVYGRATQALRPRYLPPNILGMQTPQFLRNNPILNPMGAADIGAQRLGRQYGIEETQGEGLLSPLF